MNPNKISQSKPSKKFNRKLKFDISTKYCPSYCITGRCQILSKCPYVHEDDKVAICRKFLRGNCNSVKCLLSHNLTPDKMPDCSFFLKGCCKVENCKYRHVKVSQSSTFCDDFSNGYCPKGLQCEKSHTFLCQSFNHSGQCSKGTRCILEHKKATMKLKNTKDVSSKYKKIINSKSNNKKGDLNEDYSSISNQKSVLNTLLAKRLKSTNNNFNDKLCSNPNSTTDLASLSDYVSLSSDGAFNTSKQICGPEKLPSTETESASITTSALKKKYFVIDIDEEKLSDYLNNDLSESNNICRPQLKIVPDFLL